MPRFNPRPHVSPAHQGPQVTPHERQFAARFLIHLDERRAAEEAGLPLTAHPLNRLAVRRLIVDLQAERMKRLEITQDDVLRRWWLLENASANDLVEFRRVPCEFCHGEDHRRQRTPEQMRKAQLDHLKIQLKLNEDQRREFDEAGGDGYDRNLPVYSVANGFDHNCPECHGDGVGFAYFKDTRRLTPAGQILYDGVKISKDGSIEVKMRSRSHAEEMISRHVGLMDKGAERRPLRPDEMTEEELEEVIMSQARRLGDDDDGIPLLEVAEQIGK